MLRATLYQGNPSTNHKLWNTGSTEKYIETIKCLFGHNDWEMKTIEQSAVVEDNGGNSLVQNNNDQSTQTNNDNVVNETDEDNNPEFVIPPDTSQEEYCFCRPCITNEKNPEKCGGMIVQRPLTKEIQV